MDLDFGPHGFLNGGVGGEKDERPGYAAHRDVDVGEEHFVESLEELLACHFPSGHGSVHPDNGGLICSVGIEGVGVRSVAPLGPAGFEIAKCADGGKREESRNGESRDTACDDTLE